MSIRIRSFGGPITWIFRKHYSKFTSRIMLSFAANRYDKVIKKYIDWFMKQENTPLFASCMIETINRCNGSCEFCPANVNDENRPFKKMTTEMFEDIIFQLKEMEWCGKLYLSINNEPFIDKRILDFSQFVKKNLPGVEIAMVSNGTLLSIDKLDEIVGKIDEITINDYSEQYALAKSHKEIYRHVKKHNDRFKNVRIVINRRYRKEILATRAGTAPNKPKKNNSIDTPCIYPFLDLLIFPDGKVGMCCNDCKEITDFGDITQNSLSEIWNNSKFQKLREAMSGGYRSSYPFCKECDVVDAGEREIYIRQILKDEKKLQSQGR